jgi:hypothetical protein
MQDKIEERTLIAMEERLRKEGFIADFRVADGRLTTILRPNGYQKSWASHEVQIVDFYRFEGESDPGDMAILYAIECTDGSKGTISNSYGPMADTDVDAFMGEVENLGKNLDKPVK